MHGHVACDSDWLFSNLSGWRRIAFIGCAQLENMEGGRRGVFGPLAARVVVGIVENGLHTVVRLVGLDPFRSRSAIWCRMNIAWNH